MNMNRTFTVVNDTVLVESINAARHKVVYVAPGISQPVADALGKRVKELGRLSITLIIDVDPEVYRMGYGDPEGLEMIKEFADNHLLKLRQQPGVRIGLLIADEQTLIYAPTPHLIEAGSTQPEKPNAILLTEPPAAIEKSFASSLNTLPTDAEIGKEIVKREQLEAINRDLKELPPKKFDVARIERVFNSRIQYVEFKVEGYKLSKKVAPIPTDLMGLADEPALRDRWRNAFRMFDGTNQLEVEIPERDKEGNPVIDPTTGEPKRIRYGEKALETERKQIEKDFFYKVPNFSVVIFRARRNAFDQRINQFKKRIKDYQEKVQDQIQQAIDKTVENLIEVLLPLVKQKTPDRYLKSSLSYKLDDNELREILKKDLFKEFGSTETISSPEIKVQFKDISYETIHDDKFRLALKNSGIPEKKLKELFSEHDVAPEVEQGQLVL